MLCLGHEIAQWVKALSSQAGNFSSFPMKTDKKN